MQPVNAKVLEKHIYDNLIEVVLHRLKTLRTACEEVANQKESEVEGSYVSSRSLLEETFKRVGSWSPDAYAGVVGMIREKTPKFEERFKEFCGCEDPKITSLVKKIFVFAAPDLIEQSHLFYPDDENESEITDYNRDLIALVKRAVTRAVRSVVVTSRKPKPVEENFDFVPIPEEVGIIGV
jgi:hypothetical protein